MQYLIRTNIFQAEELPLTEPIPVSEHREGINPSPLTTEYRVVTNTSGCVSKAESTESEMIFKKPFLPILFTQLKRAEVGSVWSSSSLKNSSVPNAAEIKACPAPTDS